MKTTVEIDDALLKAAKKAAIDEGITLRRFLEVSIAAQLARGRTAPAAEPPGASSDETISSILSDIATAADEYRRHRRKQAS